jgi:ornithine cyclodeaminase
MSSHNDPQILTLDEIKQRINVPELIAAIEAGFVLYSQGRVVVPPVGFLNFEEPPGDVHIKYGYVIDDDVYVLKMASGFYQNPGLNLPVSDGLILVFNQKTGQLQNILLDKCWLTDMRTAAAGAVAAKHLAPTTVKSIGIVGTGTQARMQLEMLKDVVDCDSCYIWGRDENKVQAMIEDLLSREAIKSWGLRIQSAASIEALTANCNLIVTTTSARQPLILGEHVQAGTHITAMGSDDHGKQELHADVLAKADCVVADSISQCIDHGECLYAVNDQQIQADSILELGNVIEDPAIGRSHDDQITVADLTGVAIQDIQIAKMVATQKLK